MYSQKLHLKRCIVNNNTSYKDHINMIYTKYLSVAISVTLAPNVIIIHPKNHDIAMGCSGINNILRSAHIVRCIVEPSSVVVIHTIILQNN